MELAAVVCSGHARAAGVCAKHVGLDRSSLCHRPSDTRRLLPPPPALPPCSGDSGGNVQFWDGRFGTLLAGFSQHQADVLQLAASADGNMVFAAGACCWMVLLLRGGTLALAECSAGRRGLLPV